MKTLDIIDSHTGGEPTRLVVSGGPDLGRGTLGERLDVFRTQFDDWRAGIVTEPRGSDVIVGALLCEPDDPTCAAGVIFFNNVGYLGMCGHGTIGLVVSLAHMGQDRAGAASDRDAGRRRRGDAQRRTAASACATCRRIAIGEAVHGRRAGSRPVDRRCRAGAATGFFSSPITDATLVPAHIAELTAFTAAIRDALQAQNITGADGALDRPHRTVRALGSRDGIDSRNFVLCPGNAYDRSPCGTGTSAKVACLAADGKLAPRRRVAAGEHHRQRVRGELSPDLTERRRVGDSDHHRPRAHHGRRTSLLRRSAIRSRGAFRPT